MTTMDSRASPVPSILNARLLPNLTLIRHPEKRKWHIIAAAIRQMIDLFYGKHLHEFTAPLFKMLEGDLMQIDQAIAEAEEKYDDHEIMLDLLAKCRQQSSLAYVIYESKDLTKLGMGLDAATKLKTHLSDFLDRVEAVRAVVAEQEPETDKSRRTMLEYLFWKRKKR